jgi:hypothetical protein
VPRPFEATLRFDPSGRVGKVDVSPPDGRVASCIRSRLGEVTLRSFEGDPVTARMAFEL